MNSDNVPSDRDPLLRQRCSDYLLGEMTAADAAAFESEFDSAVVAQALLRESELLCNVAARSLPAGDAIAPTPRSQPPLETTITTTRTRQRVMLLITSLAASILVLSLYRMNSPQNQIDRNATALNLESIPNPAAFEYELAKTWVDPAIDWETIDWQAVDWETTDLNGEAADDASEAVDDDSFSWMVVAVEAAMGEGERNEG
ncbi:hypothetical protein Mal15_65960 [Stieleria maiorica]|uniref:Uncharacterized protein n=1 Tax=Stieleria maiorica TaxID=2795974 RepID=A0A5B9MRG0_9BACT|nr:hypothetical protein [Stieleria maiorica]QEG02475.1 hypothetical protein Mal15_65960 [Stieleria maiorica]